MIPLAAALLLAAVDPCAPVDPTGAPEPETAAAYREIAEEELARGGLDAAAAAFRAAAAADPADLRSREALRQLCDAGAEDPLARGLRLMDAGDCRAAAAAFREARAGAPRPSAALLEGICRYELGDDVAAEAALREAEAHPPHRAEARLYLGLLALRAGDRERGLALLDAARGSPALEEAADALARAARLGGRVVLSLAAEGGWDSNVNLAPTGEPALAREADAVAALRAAALVRPWREAGPYLRVAGLLHEPLELRSYAVRGYDAAGGWRGGAGRADLLLEYAYGARTFGGDPYVSFHRLLASAWLRSRRASAGVTGFVRLESYASAWSGFDGTLAGGEVRAAWLPSPRVRLSVAYAVARDATEDDLLSYLEHGPRAEVRIVPAAGLRLGAEAGAARRAYDRFDVALGVTRRDTLLDAVAYAERDLAGGWALRLSVEARGAASNVAALEYVKVVPALGLVWARGFR